MYRTEETKDSVRQDAPPLLASSPFFDESLVIAMEPAKSWLLYTCKLNSHLRLDIDEVIYALERDQIDY